MSLKTAGFKHDAQCTRARLSTGRNLKEHRSDFILCECQTRPDVDLTEWDIQQVRAVHKRDEWRLRFVCRTTIDPEPPGDDVAGVDLGMCNFAAVSFGGESLLYPGGALKEDEYYFTKQKAKCNDSSSREATRLDRKRTGRRTHFLHALSKAIVKECVERSVGTVVVGDLGGIREDDENNDPRNWGDHGKCEKCDAVANADVNGAENIRQKVLPSLATDGVDETPCVSSAHQNAERSGDGDRDNGWLAQPAVHLFDRSEGRFAPREQVANREP